MAKAKKPTTTRTTVVKTKGRDNRADTRKAPFSNAPGISKRANRETTGNIRDAGMKPKKGR